MLDRAEFDRWRVAADDAGRAANVQADAALSNWACFLAEQAAQLAIKGLLHGIGAGAWGHDLVQLAEANREHQAHTTARRMRGKRCGTCGRSSR